MDIVSPMILQFAGSLIAILLLAWLARKLGLGGAPRLDTHSAVLDAAREAVDGFEPAGAACDSDGRAALARDHAGQIMVLKPHGSRVAGRILGPSASASLQSGGDGPVLTVDCGERTFGTVSLSLPHAQTFDAQTWADAINAL